jgi:hypothetical protein
MNRDLDTLLAKPMSEQQPELFINSLMRKIVERQHNYLSIRQKILTIIILCSLTVTSLIIMFLFDGFHITQALKEILPTITETSHTNLLVLMGCGALFYFINEAADQELF